MLQAAVGERCAVEAFGGGVPVELAVEAMQVVVAGVGLDGRLGRRQIRQALTVEHLGLQDGPERLDVAVGPRRVDLGAPTRWHERPLSAVLVRRCSQPEVIWPLKGR